MEEQPKPYGFEALLDDAVHAVRLVRMTRQFQFQEDGETVIPPESKGLHKWNFLGKMNEEISNEDKQIH